MGPALYLIARLYAVEERAKALSLSPEQRLALRHRVSARLLGKLHQYLLELHRRRCRRVRPAPRCAMR
jgi:hypothetical protein